ncbi:hypothetical protein BpHYR1_043896 [Brachionus plicatilis]|uniref:Uncharacterized protein n=1 Tax=Brachionus plicatilis TaxID=10195 RepID=A0A3M7SSV5_BRAPC|nr:hypothetical protein BpHYR1_043896 [Brachionus plicatilis]
MTYTGILKFRIKKIRSKKRFNQIPFKIPTAIMNKAMAGPVMLGAPKETKITIGKNSTQYWSKVAYDGYLFFSFIISLSNFSGRLEPLLSDNIKINNLKDQNRFLKWVTHIFILKAYIGLVLDASLFFILGLELVLKKTIKLTYLFINKSGNVFMSYKCTFLFQKARWPKKYKIKARRVNLTGVISNYLA